MTDARSNILDRLKAGAGRPKIDPAPVLPAFVSESGDLTALLKTKLVAVQSSVDIVDTDQQCGQSIIDFLQNHHCPLKVGVVPGLDVSQLSQNQQIEFYACEDFATSQTILTHAAWGIAETGSLVLPSAVERPTLANFLPDNCIVLIKEGDILPYLEDALLAVQKSEPGMPRALNLISGPSKTADIEQTLVYGAHGPIQLHVIILRSDGHD